MATTLFIVDSSPAVLGTDLFYTLDMHITVAEQLCCEVSLSGSACVLSFLSAFACLFNGGIGCTKGFEHKVRLRESVVPMQHKLCRLPLAVGDKVATELRKLEQQDITE